jgi:hypothetical protein
MNRRIVVKGVSADHNWGQRCELGKEVRMEGLNGRSSLIAPGYAPDETLEAQSRVDRIRVVLDVVGSRPREIYFAHRAGYSYAVIAEHMDISHCTIIALLKILSKNTQRRE